MILALALAGHSSLGGLVRGMHATFVPAVDDRVGGCMREVERYVSNFLASACFACH